MKTIIYLLIGIFTISAMHAQEELDDAKKLGLVAYLNTIKILAEHKVLWSEAKYVARNPLAANASAEDSITRQTIRETYGVLQWKTSLYINQLSADMVGKNSMGLYRCMNKALANPVELNSTKLKKYAPLLKEIEETYLDLRKAKYSTSIQFITPLGEILTLAGVNPYGLYKDIKATKEKKIATLIGYVKEMQLTPLAQLLKPTPKEEKKS